MVKIHAGGSELATNILKVSKQANSHRHHVDRVGHDHPVEPEAIAEQPRGHGVRERGGALIVETAVHHVRGHLRTVAQVWLNAHPC